MQSRWKNPFDYFDAIYLINLKSRPDRLEQANNELTRYGIREVRLVEGIINENPAIGCHLSHANCFMEALKNGYDRILIFEDDVEFFQNAVENLTKSLIELPADWDMFYLGANLDVYKAYQISPSIARLTGAFATHAYAIRRRLFGVLLDINTSFSTIHNDVVYSAEIHPKYNCYLSIPLIAGQRDSYSDIQKQIMSSNSIFQTRLQTNLVRMGDAANIYNSNDGEKQPK